MPVKKAVGRPRSFDRDAALEAAMLLFWRNGYDGTSIAELTKAMGIAAPSLYAAFGSKLDLYGESLQLYVSKLGQIGVASLEDAPNAKQGVHNILREAAAAFTRPGFPPGCMIGVGSLRCAEENRVAEDATRNLRQMSFDAVLARIERAKAEGELGPAIDPAAIADFYSAVVEGMSVLAADGASTQRLTALGDMAMNAWPQ